MASENTGKPYAAPICFHHRSNGYSAKIQGKRGCTTIPIDMKKQSIPVAWHQGMRVGPGFYSFHP